MKPACIDCEYAEVTEPPSELYLCRRYAPRPVPGGVVPVEGCWPLVKPEDWCGEFLERESMDDLTE